MATYKWSDPEFVDKIILEVKSQGHFDTFRKECLADVDTQPAYQNLHSRVEDTVQRFLNRQVWTPEIKNKNRLREDMKANIIRAGFLESGVSRIVDQVVEQKMDYIQSKVEEILYNYVGIEKPKKEEKQNGSLEIDTALLPTDLEQVSPDSTSDKKSAGSIKEEIEEEVIEDEDFESPAFEPIEPTKAEKNEQENSENTNLSEISGLTSQDSAKSHKSDPTNIEDQNKIDTALSQISSTQDNIPDTSEMPNPHVPNVLNVSGICGEEAQMATGLNDSTENEIKTFEAEKSIEQPKCQFDLKKDQIEFTGTERKSINLDDSTNSGESEKVIQPKDVQNMVVENLYENDTTDSSEMKMEIDLKEETTQGTAVSSKIEESSQDSLKNKDKKSHKHDRSKSSFHKASNRHQHSSSSSKSKHEESSRHKTYSSNHKSSSSHKKHSGDKEKEKSSRKDHKDKDRKSEASKSRSKQDDLKQNDDHHQEKLSKRRRSTDNDSGDSKDIAKPNNNVPRSQIAEVTAKENGKSTARQPENGKEKKKSENKDDEMELELNAGNSNKSKESKEQKSAILVKYDYLKSPCEPLKSAQKSADDDNESMDSDFCGFEAEELPENPWFECISLMQSNKFPFASNNNYISKKNDRSKKSKSKTPDLSDSLNLSNDSEHNTPMQKSQIATQRYDANDLYKPKFDFSRRRRGQAMEDGTNKGKETTPASN